MQKNGHGRRPEPQLARHRFGRLLMCAAATDNRLFQQRHAIDAGQNLAAFRNGLKQAGLVEGQNVAIEFVWAGNRFDGLEALAAEVIARRPSVIVSNTLAAMRAKSLTTTIAIVFTTGSGA